MNHSTRIVRSFSFTRLCTNSAILLVVIVYDCVAATSFFPKTSNTKPQSNGAVDKTAAKVTSTQINIATITTTGQPLTTPIGFWSPQHGGLFIPRRQNLKSNSKKERENSKDAIKPSSVGGLNLDWVGMIPSIRMESVQVIAERLTTDTIQPIWNTAMKAMEDQLLSHVYNSVSKSTTAAKTDVAVAVDPGDFLCEMNGWSAYFDREGTCLIYYFHKQTGASQWEIPYPDYPIPKLNHQQVLMMKQKYQESHVPLPTVLLSLDDGNSSSNQIPGNDIFQSIQNLLSGGNNKDEKEPEKKPDDKNRNNKPWWSAVLDVVFEKSDDNQNESAVSVYNSKSGNANVVDGSLPFFATMQNEEKESTTFDTVSPSLSTTSSDILQSIDALSTTLSPWWDMLRDVVVKVAATTLELQTANDEVVDKVDNPPKVQRQENQLWDYFFPVKNDKNEIIDSQPTITVKSSIKKQSRLEPEIESPLDVSNTNVLGWMSDLPLFLTRDVSRTVPLFGLFPKKSNEVKDKALIVAVTVPLRDVASLSKQKQPSHAERLKVIEEKRYAASRARQANLRKTYGTVIHDRSPTVSLTSIKLQKSKSSNQNIDWYKYLDD